MDERSCSEVFCSLATQRGGAQLPGGGGHAGMIMYDTEKKLGGTHRYSNSSLCCSPRVQYPPPPPPNIPSPIDLVHIPADKEPLLSGDEAREGKGFGDDGVGACTLRFSLVCARPC